MNDRYLTITMQADWQAGLRAAGKAAAASSYQGEVLNFESPGHFFGQLTEKRQGDCSRCSRKRGVGSSRTRPYRTEGRQARS